LQANDAGQPILLHVETKAGHRAGKPTSKQIEEMADIYSFLFKILNVTRCRFDAYVAVENDATNQRLRRASGGRPGRPLRGKSSVREHRFTCNLACEHCHVASSPRRRADELGDDDGCCASCVKPTPAYRHHGRSG
jgi:hypothetical protein